MVSVAVNRTKFFLCLLAMLGGCTTIAPPSQVPAEVPPVVALPPDAVPDARPGMPAEPTVPDAPVAAPDAPIEALPVPPVRKETIAIASLIERANTDAKAGRLANAAASIERALRIEPRNPRLWHELARIRVQQGDYLQAESTAARANSWSQGDAALRAANWRIIAEARQARGDRAGARTALETAERQK